MFLLAAHSAHCAHVQRQVHDQLAGGQLIHLQDVPDIVDIADQQVVLVDGGDKACQVCDKNREYCVSLYLKPACDMNIIIQTTSKVGHKPSRSLLQKNTICFVILFLIYIFGNVPHVDFDISRIEI